MSDLTTFAAQFTFACPICKKRNDYRVTIRATNVKVAHEHARGMLIPCKSCRAKIGADEGMIRLTEQSEQKG